MRGGHERTGMTGRRDGLVVPLVLFGALALVPLLSPWLGGSYLMLLTARVMIFALAAMSLDLVLGFGGLVSFGHAAFLGIGAYAAGITIAEDRGDVLLALPLALAVAAGFAAFTGKTSAVPAMSPRQSADSGQRSHRGRRGVQTPAPRSIIAWV